MEACSPSCSITSASPLALRAKHQNTSAERHRRTQNDPGHAPAKSHSKLLCPFAIFCGCIAFLGAARTCSREAKAKIALTTDFTARTDYFGARFSYPRHPWFNSSWFKTGFVAWEGCLQGRRTQYGVVGRKPDANDFDLRPKISPVNTST